MLLSSVHIEFVLLGEMWRDVEHHLFDRARKGERLSRSLADPYVEDNARAEPAPASSSSRSRIAGDPARLGCGRRPLVKDRDVVELADLPCFVRQTRLLWRKVRWACPDVDCDHDPSDLVRTGRGGAAPMKPAPNPFHPRQSHRQEDRANKGFVRYQERVCLREAVTPQPS